jgi:hypothetical protein
LEKARSVIDENFWWSKHSGKLFVLPYGRSDSARVAITGGGGRNKTRVVHKPGCVYTTTNNICNYEIPEQLPLDYEFGYLVGAYCAEGCMTKHQISIANNDLNYFAPIEAWCARHNLTTKVYCHENKIQEGWTSQDIRIYSTILCRILEKLCGKLSHNKFISDLIVFSNRACLLGFLDAYIGGDGTVAKKKERIAGISVSSVSLKMLSQVQLILRNLGVIGKINKPPKQLTNNRGSLDIKQIYNLVVSNEQSKKLGRMLNLPIQHKRERIEQLLGQTFMYNYCKSDLEVPNLIDGEIVMEPRDGRFPDLEFDEIVSIEEVPNTTNYAYDLTVEETRNFDLANGLSQRDTFHNSGNASKSNVTRGVPRIEEILRLTKNPKNPSMTVFLKPLDEGHSEKAKQFANMMDHTKLADIVSSVQICFDPDEFNTRVRDDVELMEKYYEFSRMVDECNVPDPSSGMGGGASATITGIEVALGGPHGNGHGNDVGQKHYHGRHSFRRKERSQRFGRGLCLFRLQFRQVGVPYPYVQCGVDEKTESIVSGGCSSRAVGPDRRNLFVETVPGRFVEQCGVARRERHRQRGAAQNEQPGVEGGGQVQQEGDVDVGHHGVESVGHVGAGLHRLDTHLQQRHPRGV